MILGSISAISSFQNVFSFPPFSVRLKELLQPCPQSSRLPSILLLGIQSCTSGVIFFQFGQPYLVMKPHWTDLTNRDIQSKIKSKPATVSENSGAPNGTFCAKDVRTIKQRMNKAFWSHFNNFGRLGKMICSSLPARLLMELMEVFPASKVHLHSATRLTGKFRSRCMYTHYWPVWVWS